MLEIWDDERCNFKFVPTREDKTNAFAYISRDAPGRGIDGATAFETVVKPHLEKNGFYVEKLWERGSESDPPLPGLTPGCHPGGEWAAVVVDRGLDSNRLSGREGCSWL